MRRRLLLTWWQKMAAAIVVIFAILGGAGGFVQGAGVVFDYYCAADPSGRWSPDQSGSAFLFCSGLTVGPMSHNISDRTRRANIPAGCLDDLLDWRFLITSPRCRKQRIITVTVMAAQAGGASE